tara:strand:- start:96 stop:281 length:186 start_codon:yes stop_codon:yes gene_type:complete
MPRRTVETHMVVKTKDGYVKIDKDNNQETIVTEELLDFLGDIGALGGQAKESYEKRKKKTS